MAVGWLTDSDPHTLFHLRKHVETVETSKGPELKKPRLADASASASARCSHDSFSLISNSSAAQKVQRAERLPFEENFMSSSMLRRLNGRPQACDPCRSRKVACDHTQPICNRCRKRNQDNDCIYTVSTHTVPASLRSARLRSERSVTRPSSGSSRDVESTGRMSTPTDAAASLRPSHNNSASQSPRASTLYRAPLPGSGYLGFTSYSTVYEETRNRLNHLKGTPIVSSDSSPDNYTRPSEHTTGSLSLPTLGISLIVLRNLPDLSIKEVPPRESPHPLFRWNRGAAQIVLESLQEYLPSQSRHEDRLEELAHLLYRNTSKPVNDNLEDSEEWIAQFVGQNLRWESLGLLFACRELFGHEFERGNGRLERHQTSWKTALECLRLCIELAANITGGNVMLLYICYQRTTTISVTGGDECEPMPPKTTIVFPMQSSPD